MSKNPYLGTLYKGTDRSGKKSKVWSLQYFIKTQDGTTIRKRESLGVTDRKAAVVEATKRTGALLSKDQADKYEALARRAAKSRDQVARIEADQNRTPLAAAWDKFPYIETTRGSTRRELKPRVIANNRQAWEAFAKWSAANRPAARFMQDITEADALAYSDHCRTAAKLGARGHNKRVEVCRVVFNLAGILPNPFAKVRNWTENQQHRDALELPDLQRIMAAATGEYRLLIAIGIFTGLRLGDAVNLQWQDIHDNRIWKATQKTGKPVSLALAPALAAELAKVERPTDGRGYALPELAALYGRDPTSVSKRIRQLFEGVGIEVTEKMAGRAKAISRRGFHSLRTSFVTYCARAGIPTEAIAQWAGHSPEVDRLYQRHSGKDTDARFLGVLQGVAMVTLPASIQTPAIDVEGVEIEDVETLRIKLFRRLESADRETLTRILAIL